MDHSCISDDINEVMEAHNQILDIMGNDIFIKGFFLWNCGQIQDGVQDQIEQGMGTLVAWRRSSALHTSVLPDQVEGSLGWACLRGAAPTQRPSTAPGNLT